MKSVRELRAEFQQIKSKKMSKLDKRPLVLKVLGGVSEIEREAIKNYSFPLVEIRKAKQFMAEIEGWLR